MDWHRLFKSIRRTTAQEAIPPDGQSLSASKDKEDQDRISRIVQRFTDPDRATRLHEIEALVALGSKAQLAVPELIPLLQHADRDVRRDAVMAVGRIGQMGAAAIPDLLKSLADQDGGVRRAARIAILQVDPQANALLMALRDPDARIRKSATDALPRVARLSPPPVGTLVAHLADDNQDIRYNAIATLVSIGSPAVPALINSLNDDRIRGAAIRVLAEMKGTAAPAIKPLIELTHDHDGELTLKVVRALREIGPGAISSLVNLLDEQEHDVPFLRPRELDDTFRRMYGVGLPPRDTVSSTVCSALAQMGAVSQLVAALRHAREHVRWCAARALGNMRAEARSATFALISALADPSEEVRMAAAAALWAVLPDPAARVDTLLMAVSDEHSPITAHVPWALLFGEAEVPALMKSLLSDNAGVKRTAAWALREVLPALTHVHLPSGSSDYTLDYRTLTPDDVSELLRDRPGVFEYLSRLHSPDTRANITGPVPRGAEDLPELIAKVRERQMLLFQAETALEESTASQAESFIASSVEPQRFTDLTIYEGGLYRNDDLSKEARLSDQLPLVAGQPYTLEVAVRRKRTGIDAQLDAPAVDNPRQDKEDLTIFVLAEAQWSGIEIKESFARMKWPYDADSESAFFRLEVKPVETGTRISQGTIEIRLYDRALDLLDIVDLTVAVVPEGSGLRVPDVPARSLSWPCKNQGSPKFDPHSPPRALNIDVSFDSSTQGYRLLFKFLRNDGNNSVSIPGITTMTTKDIEDLLVRIRDFWTDLVITNYADSLTVTRTTFDKHLTSLRELGMQAWTLLFGARYAAREGASETIGELLKEMELKEGALIQITKSPRDFIFPWSILHPPVADSKPVDPLQFWGARYQFEQVIDGPKNDLLTDEPINIAFVLDSGFGNSQEQETLLQKYQANAHEKLLVTHPISDEKTLFQELSRTPSAHLLYCYCHGYAPAGSNILRRDGVKLMQERIEDLKPDTPERQALETLLVLTAKMRDEAWIYIGGAEITENRLKRQNFFERRRPIVFLNMCQSADLFPSMSSGLVRVFLDHNASAVVGTECPMTAVFASAFAEEVFNALFGGDDIGTALWKSRRHFLNQLRNPLGLAYTLYGRAVARLGTGPIIQPPTTSQLDTAVTRN